MPSGAILEENRFGFFYNNAAEIKMGKLFRLIYFAG